MKCVSGNSGDEIGRYLNKWLEETTGCKLHSPYSAVGIHNGFKLMGVAIFVDFNGSNIEVHMYAPKCLNREVIKYLFNYVFNELKCNIIRAKPLCNNKKAIATLQKLGFQFECTLEDYYGKNNNAMVFKFKRNWAEKWIKLNAIF